VVKAQELIWHRIYELEIEDKKEMPNVSWGNRLDVEIEMEDV